MGLSRGGRGKETLINVHEIEVVENKHSLP